MEDVFNLIEKFFRDRYIGWRGGVSQFEGSGERLRKLYNEMCWSSRDIEDEVSKQLKAVFSSEFNEMLTSGPTNVWSLCPHHLLPCNFKVYIGYIPSGPVLGLSKFSRVAVALAKRPIMQEQYSKDIADTLENSLKPLGLGIHVVGKHGCMGCRGILQDNVEVTTTVLRGCFLNESGCKSEFLGKIIGSGRS